MVILTLNKPVCLKVGHIEYVHSFMTFLKGRLLFYKDPMVGNIQATFLLVNCIVVGRKRWLIAD